MTWNDEMKLRYCSVKHQSTVKTSPIDNTVSKKAINPKTAPALKNKTAKVKAKKKKIETSSDSSDSSPPRPDTRDKKKSAKIKAKKKIVTSSDSSDSSLSSSSLSESSSEASDSSSQSESTTTNSLPIIRKKSSRINVGEVNFKELPPVENIPTLDLFKIKKEKPTNEEITILGENDTNKGSPASANKTYNNEEQNRLKNKWVEYNKKEKAMDENEDREIMRLATERKMLIIEKQELAREEDKYNKQKYQEEQERRVKERKEKEETERVNTERTLKRRYSSSERDHRDYREDRYTRAELRDYRKDRDDYHTRYTRKEQSRRYYRSYDHKKDGYSKSPHSKDYNYGDRTDRDYGRDQGRNKYEDKYQNKRNYY